LVVVLLTSALPSPGGRSAVLLAANLGFIGSYVDSVSQVAPLAAFLLLGLLSVEGVRRSRSSLSLWIGISILLATFVVLKRFKFLGEPLLLPFPYLMVGLSYVLFRVLHLLIDAKQGQLARPISPLHFFNYTCNFLCFTAGPIQRYEAYESQRQQALELDEGKVFRAFARVVRGFFKVAVISGIFDYLFAAASARVLDPMLSPALPAFAVLYALAALFYTIHLYANFSGYVDIVIGVAALMGQDLPENFNRPFQARNFLDFWARWHMTLSDWFKTYVFNPLLMMLTARFSSPRAGPYLGVFTFFVTFLIMGVWHGTTSVFVVYGLMMGAGASLNKLWQTVMNKQLGKQRYRALSQRTGAIYLSRGLTLAYFALALTCLWVDLELLLLLTQRLGVLGVGACYLGLSLASGVALMIWERSISRLASLRPLVEGVFNGVLARNLGLAVQMLLVMTVSSFFHKAPEFVYRAF
jgi:D-alanyl-lipoteichoic acid acyltransferase DltB (MBOAT superfamily)